MNRQVLVLLLLAVGCANSLRQRRQANGCGAAGSFNLDWSLRAVGERVITQCCNSHDLCYDRCGRTQTECDTAFRACLDRACGTLKGKGFNWWIEIRQAACKLDGRTLFSIVNAWGSSAYNAAQKAHGCRG